MVDVVDTFLTTLYVITDDFCQRLTHTPAAAWPREASLWQGELITPWPSSPGGLEIRERTGLLPLCLQQP
jgi:hypothetical protein